MTLPTILVSPAEKPPVLRALGNSSAYTEHCGCDFMWKARGRWWGIQRKELHDFLASYSDGRLARELPLMRGFLSLPIIVIEGKPRYTNDGLLMTNSFARDRDRWTYEALFNALMSVRAEGAQIMSTDNVKDTALLIQRVAEWSTREHMSLRTRGGATTNDPWGRIDHRDEGLWMLQGLPRCGPKLAAAVFDHFGRVPWRWDVEISQLMEVRGVGKELARRWVAVFQSRDATNQRVSQ